MLPVVIGTARRTQVCRVNTKLFKLLIYIIPVVIKTSQKLA